MYKQRLNYVIVGAFVTAMLAAGILSVALLAGRTGAVDSYFIVFDNVADVKFGTQVRYEGYPVGQVDDIAPVEHGGGMRFRVNVSVQHGWRIPDDSVARVGSSSFLAAKTIDIAAGQSEAAVAPGGEIPGAPAADIFATINATAAEISDLNRRNIRPLVETLHSLAETVEADAPRITQQVTAFTERLNASVEPLQDLLAPQNVEAVRHSVRNMEETTANLAAISGDLSDTLAKVDNVAGNLDRLVEDNQASVDQSLKDVRYTLSSIAATVDSVVHNLEGTARNMNEFSRLIRRNPGLLLDGTPRQAVSPARGRASEAGG